MGLLSRGMTWLADQTATAGGVTVTYTRGGKKAVLTATPGDQQQQANAKLTTQAGVIAWSQRDYFIAAADLAAAGFDLPLVGDRVTEAVGGEVTVFELMRGPNGEPCWRWSEADRLTYRVHTKRVSG